ncbi:hypothetical protein [Paenibacillus faecalis]|uniref:hypothetical protein n=1 Tax=Paenibacillus faecalis TaxID=2079532 RepID=UPI00131A5A7D|nr:hypothetical protein [Paenibacillus faecalis]
MSGRPTAVTQRNIVRWELRAVRMYKKETVSSSFLLKDNGTVSCENEAATYELYSDLHEV